MIDSPRRHGHFDTRWQIDAQPMRTPAAFSARACDDSASIQDWENEGGRSTGRGRPVAETRSRQRSGALEWSAFTTRYFPGTRRHDFGAVSAYESYLAHRGGRGPRAAPHASSPLNSGLAPR
jgi:hypothetical protein